MSKYIATLMASFCIVLISNSAEPLIKASELKALLKTPVKYRYWTKAATSRVPLPSNIQEYSAPTVKVAFFSNVTIGIMPTVSPEYKIEFIAPPSSSAKLYAEIAQLEADKKLDTQRIVYSAEEIDQILKVLDAKLVDAEKSKDE